MTLDDQVVGSCGCNYCLSSVSQWSVSSVRQGRSWAFRSSVERVTEGVLGCNCVLVSFAFFPSSYPTLTQGHSLSFPPSPFIFALFPDCLGTRQVVARFGVLLTRGNLAAVSPFSAPLRSDPFTGWVPPNLLGAPSPFSVSCWVDRCSYTRFPFGFLLRA